MRIAGWLALGWVLFLPSGYGWSIQNVSGPVEQEDTEIRRYDIHLEEDTVVWGSCDSIESECLPNTPSFRAKRKMPFTEYQTKLAELFQIEPRYLLNDDKMDANFNSMKKTLQSIIESESTAADEKQNARTKFDALTGKGAIIDRFTQARAIKRSLPWDPENPEAHAVTFEKSQKQFSQAAYPINFAKDIEAPSDPLRRFEPSTELTWAFAGNNLTRLEARAACAQKGRTFRVMRYADWKASEAWIKLSALGAAVTASGDGRKSIWLEEYQNRGFEAQFQYVTVSAQKSEQVTSVIKSTQHIDEGKMSAIDAVGGSTAKISVICISSQRSEE